MADEAPPSPETPVNPIEPADPQPIGQAKLLIGEGRDEVVFFEALLRHLNITGVQLEQYGGKTKLRAYLETLPLRPGFAALESLGITRDADASAKSAFESVRDALLSFNLPAPERAVKPAVGPPRANVLIFPGGRKQKGMLEDLCLASVASDGAIPCVDEFLRCVRRRAKRTPKNLAKARVQAWLASQKDSDLQLGLAAQKGLWDWTSPVFDELKHFLRSL